MREVIINARTAYILRQVSKFTQIPLEGAALRLVLFLLRYAAGGMEMQQVHPRRIGIGDRSRISPWRTDESEAVNESIVAEWKRRDSHRVTVGAIFSGGARGFNGRT